MNGAKAIALGTAALALIGLSACSTDTSDEGATGHNYVTAYGCEPKRGLVPADTNEICGTRVVRSIFAGLVSVDEKATPTMTSQRTSASKVTAPTMSLSKTASSSPTVRR